MNMYLLWIMPDSDMKCFTLGLVLFIIAAINYDDNDPDLVMWFPRGEGDVTNKGVGTLWWGTGDRLITGAAGQTIFNHTISHT